MCDIRIVSQTKVLDKISHKRVFYMKYVRGMTAFQQDGDHLHQ